MKLRVNLVVSGLLLVALPGFGVAACAMQVAPPGSSNGAGGQNQNAGGVPSSGGVSGSSGGIAGSVAAGGVAGSVAAGGVAGSVAAGGGAGVGGSVAGAGGSTGGAGSGGGGAGSGGAGSGGGGTGGAGTGGGGTGGGGAGGGGSTCAGCARLSVPLATSTDHANFMLLTGAAVDLTGATVTYRVCKEQGTTGFVQGYVQYNVADFSQIFGGYTTIANVNDCSAGFENIVFNVGADATAFDKTNVGRIGFQISGNSGTTSASPAVILVDSITISGNPAGPFEFATMTTISTTTSGTPGVLFLNTSDTPVTGSAISWLGP